MFSSSSSSSSHSSMEKKHSEASAKLVGNRHDNNNNNNNIPHRFLAFICLCFLSLIFLIIEEPQQAFHNASRNIQWEDTISTKSNSVSKVSNNRQINTGATALSLSKKSANPHSLPQKSLNALSALSTSTQDNGSNNRSKPYLIFHVGPPKSATTTIQCGLAKMSYELATWDNYYYLGKPCRLLEGYSNTGRMPNNETAIGLFHAYSEINSLSRKFGNDVISKIGNAHAVSKLLERLDHHSHLGHNIILSSENFVYGVRHGRADIVNQHAFTLMNRLFQNYTIRVVTTYRRYFEWIPSQYFQSTFNEGKNGAIESRSLLKHVLDNLNKGHPTIKSYQTYQKQPKFQDDVYIFNMYEEGDLVTNFFCHALHDAINVCHNRTSTTAKDRIVTDQQATTQEIVVRTSKSLDFKQLYAVAKQQLDFLQTKKNDKIYSSTYEKRFDYYRTKYSQEYRSNFQTCLLKEQLDLLLNKSLEYEKQLITLATTAVASAERYSRNSHLQMLLNHDRIQNHRDAFDKDEKAGKFCEINITSALGNTSFIKFVFGRPKTKSIDGF